jgi:hypothetical protein
MTGYTIKSLGVLLLLLGTLQRNQGLKAQSQPTWIGEFQAGIQNIYPKSLLNDQRAYTEPAFGVNGLYQHNFWGLEMGAHYGHDRNRSSQVHHVNYGAGLSMRINKGLFAQKESAYASTGYFRNAQEQGIYGAFRLRTKGFSYGFRYQRALGKEGSGLQTASLTLGYVITRIP